VPIVIPIGKEDYFEGVVDLIKMKAIYLGRSVAGDEVRLPRDPGRVAGSPTNGASKMVEAAAESSEELMNKYLDEGELSEADLIKGLRDRTIACEIQPMLCGTAFKNKGVQRMLDAVIDLLPSPVDIPPVTGEKENGDPDTREASDSAKFSALAFKLMTDPYVGQLTFIRVYSGVLKSGDTMYNPIKGRRERIGRVLQMHANNREESRKSSPATSPPVSA
jgi:elongation factor G